MSAHDSPAEPLVDRGPSLRPTAPSSKSTLGDGAPQGTDSCHRRDEAAPYPAVPARPGTVATAAVDGHARTAAGRVTEGSSGADAGESAERRLPMAARRYLLLRLLLIYLGLVVAGGLALSALTLPSWITPTRGWIILGLVGAFVLLDALTDIRKVATTRYRFRGSAFEVDSGAFYRVCRTVPTASIQHCSVASTPLLRRFALVKLELHTLQGIIAVTPVSQQQAEWVVSRVSRLRAASGGDSTATAVLGNGPR